jgi:hypothetical protein
VSAAGTGIIVLVTAIVALRALRDARSTRHGLLITEIMRQWADPVIVESIRFHPEYPSDKLAALVDRLHGPADELPTDEDDWSRLVVWANLIEAMGVLASVHAITEDVIYEMWGGGILKAWGSWERAVFKIREYDGQPETFLHFQELARAVQGINRSRLERAIASEYASRAAAAAEPGKDVQQSSAPPPSSLAGDVPNRSASGTRRGLRLLMMLIVLSAIGRRVMRN